MRRYQTLSCFSVLQATESWVEVGGGGWVQGYMYMFFYVGWGLETRLLTLSNLLLPRVKGQVQVAAHDEYIA